jgi:hypothetical protein
VHCHCGRRRGLWEGKVVVVMARGVEISHQSRAVRGLGSAAVALLPVVLLQLLPVD